MTRGLTLVNAVALLGYILTVANVPGGFLVLAVGLGVLMGRDAAKAGGLSGRCVPLCRSKSTLKSLRRQDHEQ